MSIKLILSLSFGCFYLISIFYYCLKEHEDENYELLKQNRTLMEENENLRDDIERMRRQHEAEIESNKKRYNEDFKCLHDRIGVSFCFFWFFPKNFGCP